MVKAIVLLAALVASTSIHAQPTSAWSNNSYQAPKSTMQDTYKPPKSRWSEPNAYQAPKSTSGEIPRRPSKRQAPDSWWSDPAHQNPPKSSWADR